MLLLLARPAAFAINCVQFIANSADWPFCQFAVIKKGNLVFQLQEERRQGGLNLSLLILSHPASLVLLMLLDLGSNLLVCLLLAQLPLVGLKYLMEILFCSYVVDRQMILCRTCRPLLMCSHQTLLLFGVAQVKPYFWLSLLDSSWRGHLQRWAGSPKILWYSVLR